MANKARVLDGPRGVQSQERNNHKQPIPHRVSGKRVFGSRFRGLYLERCDRPLQVVNGVVIPADMVQVRFEDYVAVLDPSLAADRRKIEMLESHKCFGTWVWDRDVAADAENMAVAQRLSADLAKAMENPEVKAYLQIAAGKRGFNLAAEPETKQPEA